jgi:SAM-dependent methyltransferase
MLTSFERRPVSAEGPAAGPPVRFAEPRRVVDLGDCGFYHTMDLPGLGRVPGTWDLTGQFDEYVGHVPLARRTLLDVGASNGFLTFEAERRGAQVVSMDAESGEALNRLPFTDAPSRPDALDHRVDKVKNAYWLAHRLLGSRARAYYGDIYRLPEALGRFDVVLVGQVLVHLRDAVTALASVTARCAETLVLVEGTLDADEPLARFLGRASAPERPAAWWHYSLGFYREVLDMRGFRLEAAVTRPFPCDAPGMPRAVPLTTIVARRRTGAGG